ncbi:OB-fold nucleic acid binding domain-containing protein [Leekyejoonella antrihumi]|uniref:DNA-binding protein n=1 Tax=Leekyejoonella antrihumi TaxID=1660198 RepID=A0A563E3E5_9MICO|nr:OB-fold nucleic acid binding domain-containing protein [Leekyejoonella antrihumi]TWP36935.1 DNA-binding protein [Leekyejoonella antrihumi]
MGHKRGLAKVAARLVRSPGAIEREELQETCARIGGTPIDKAPDGCVSECTGTVQCLSLRPRGNDAPALVVDLDDGSRTMNLIWLGRRKIAGIEPGVFLTVRGRVLYRHGVPTIFNPIYEIKPSTPAS